MSARIWLCRRACWCLGFMMLAAGPLRAAGPAETETAASADAAKPAVSADAAAESSAKTYRLRYRFKAGETIRWQVEHRARVTTTVSGSTQTAETLSRSIKVWRIKELAAAPHPAVVFEHLVENVEMRQKLSGREEVVYNSATDVVPPAGFEQAAQSVGVVLARVTMDLRGMIVQREGAVADVEGQSPLTLPLPEEAVPVGHTWYAPSETTVKLKDGQVRTVKLRQRCTLAEVRDGIAKIEVESQIITPIRDQPELEAQLIQRQSSGELQFDIAAGRLLSHRLELDKRVVGFSGEQSSLHYVTRFTEELVPAVPTVTVRPTKPPTRIAPSEGESASGSDTATAPRVAQTPDAQAGESSAKKPAAKSKGKPGRSNLRRR